MVKNAENENIKNRTFRVYYVSTAFLFRENLRHVTDWRPLPPPRSAARGSLGSRRAVISVNPTTQQDNNYIK